METTENMRKKQLKRVFDRVSGRSGVGPQFFDRQICQAVVLGSLHPEGAKCPSCGQEPYGKKHEAFWSGKTIKCRCGKKYSGRSGTALSGKSLTDREIVFMFFLIGLGLTDDQVADHVGCNRETVRLWRRDLDNN